VKDTREIKQQLMDIAKFYNDLSDKYPPGSSAAVDGSSRSNKKRYEVLTEGLDGKTVLDVGCGQGNILGHLVSHENRILCKSYTGIDISSRMIEEAEKIYSTTDDRMEQTIPSTFIHTPLQEYDPIDVMTDKTKRYDFVIAQGIFYKLENNPAGYHEALKLIMLMARLGKQVRFCALSTWGENTENELLIDPSLMTQWIRENLTRNVVMNHSYLPHDVCFTIGEESY